MIHSIAVIGLGQIGGSLVLSLRKAKLPVRIIGVDISRKRLNLLAPYLDQRATTWKAASEADLIVLCLHYDDLMRFLKKDHSGKLLLDVCSGKERVVAVAEERKLRFIGGHPLAGNEHAGEKGWRHALFQSAPFFLCPTKSVTAKEYRQVKQLIRRIGARPVEIDAAMHDRFMALASHFPAILSGMLFDVTNGVPSIFHGPGYKSMTRLAATSPDLLRTFVKSNGRNIKVCALRLRRELDRWIKKELK